MIVSLSASLTLTALAMFLVALASTDWSDILTTGSYIIDMDGSTATAGGAALTVRFKQSDGSTAATPTSGAMTIAVEYKAST